MPSDGLAERVETLIRTISPLLDLVIAGPFREYTLHNPAHAKKLVHLCEYFLPEETLNALSTLELALIISSCYLHDLGMTLTNDERQRLLGSPDFVDSLRLWPAISQELKATRLQAETASVGDRFLLETRLYQLQEAALASFLRGIHATRERYVDLIRLLKDSSGRSDLFEVSGGSFQDELIDVCVSHNLDVGSLLETRGIYRDRFPRDLTISGWRINTQFCAAVLRLADILDFDRERTPRVLFESLGVSGSTLPGATLSLREWNKHLAVHTISLSANELVISADSTHPAIERSINDFCAVIEREVRDTLSVLRRNPSDIGEVYRIDLPLTVRPHVRSIGYVYRDYAFRLNESSISKILMGEGLYANKAAALRELLQNSIDACRVRALLGRESDYVPSISLSYFEDASGRLWVEVTDNGIGMDEFVLSNYFFRVGDSYYSSADFERMLRDKTFTPISRFGIGVLSVFMIGDILEVATRNVNSPRGDTTHRTARVEGRFGLAFVTEDQTGREGTRVRIRLAFKNLGGSLLFLAQAASYLRDTVRRPAVPVEVKLPNVSFTIQPTVYLKLNEERVIQLHARRIEPVVLDISRWSERMTGKVILFFHMRDDGLLSRSDGTRKVLLYNEELKHFLSDYHGNRLTVNGISMTMGKLGKLLGPKDEKVTMAVDVDVPGEEDIRYDVARNKVIGSAVPIIRTSLRRAIIEGLRGLQILDRLDADSRLLIEDPSAFESTNPISEVPPEVLAAVRPELPSSPWPVGLHRTIADRLQIPPWLVFRAISLLLSTGQVQKKLNDSGDPGAARGN
jgi:molecular chaperone HtpG